MTIDNIYLRMIKATLVFAFLLCLSSFFLWGCNSGGPGSDDSAATDLSDKAGDDAGDYSGKALIGSSTGGAITVETNEGLQVMIDIPGGAMDFSKEITLTVSDIDLSGEQPELAVRIEPGVALWESAQLTVLFPAGFDGSGMVVCRNGSELAPLKQGQSGRSIIASLYRLGEFSCTVPNVEDMKTAAYDLIDQAPSGEWQESYAAFDALLWLCDYFISTGNSRESADCFAAIAGKSLEQVELFVDSVGSFDKESLEYRALEKFKRLMALCENPEDVNQAIDTLLEAAL